MKKENLIIVLLLLILLILTYNTFLINRNYSSSSVASMANTAAESPISLLQNPETKTNPYINADLKTELLENKDGSFGYRILLNGAVMIEQPNVPGMTGTAGLRRVKKQLMLPSLLF